MNEITFTVIVTVPDHRIPFAVGEVLICDESGREIPYPCRKPSKWSEVGTRDTASIEEALKWARELN